MLAHRASWEVERGKIPAGMLVLHKCDNPRCINVEHLRLGTAQDNSTDMALKGRGVGCRNNPAKGDGHWAARLTEEKVTWAREQHRKGRSYRRIATSLNVSTTAVVQAITRKTWKHVS